MNEKTPKDFEKYIGKIINKYIPILLLQRHIWKVERGTTSDTALMECVYSYPYLNVTIRYSEKAFQDWRKGEDMVPFIVHEMCHPITDPLYAKAASRWICQEDLLDERERLTDLISYIVLKLQKHE